MNDSLQSSPASLLTAVQRYASEIGDSVDLAELQTPFPGQALDIPFHCYEQAAPED